MKSVLTILLAAAIGAMAQTNLLQELTIGERTFRNVKISSWTATHAFIHHDGGAAKVAIADLPVDLQKQLNYDPAKAPEALAESTAKAQEIKEKLAKYQAELARVDAWRGEPTQLTVTQITSRGVLLATGKEVIVRGLPRTIGQYFNDVSRAQHQERFAREELTKAERAMSLLPTFINATPQEIAYYEAQSRAAKQALYRAQDKFEKAASELNALEAARGQTTTITARQTAQKWGGLEVWEYSPNSAPAGITVATNETKSER